MNNALKALESARSRVVQAFPYYAPILFSVRFIERPTISSFSLDRWRRLYYSPEYVLKRTIRELSGILFQIAEGILREQDERRSSRDSIVWFLASLLETSNQIIDHPSVGLSTESVYPGYYNFPAHLSAEEYYVLLKRLPEIKLPWTAIGADGEEIETASTFILGTGTTPVAPGSFMLEGDFPWEDSEPGIKEFRLDPMLSLGLNAISERERRRTCGNYGAGKGSSDSLNRAKPAASRIDWRDKLLFEIGLSQQLGSGSTIFTWSIPNLNQQVLSDDLVLPSYDATTPKILMIVDTSGSMEKEHFEFALGEIEECINILCASDGVFVIPTDAQAKPVQRVYSAKELLLIGGGGTDMGQGLLKAEEFYPIPDCVLVITDGVTGWPSEKPKRLENVIILNVSRDWSYKYASQYPAPKWATLIEMFPAEKRSS